MTCFALSLFAVALVVSLISCQSPQYCRLYYAEDETHIETNSTIASDEGDQFKFIEYEAPADGCVCDNSRCLIKCCPYGETINQEINCAKTNNSLSYNYVLHDVTKEVDIRSFNLVYVFNASCFEMQSETYLQQDGTLYLRNEDVYLSQIEFCWDINEYGQPTQWECGFSTSLDSLVQATSSTGTTSVEFG